MYRPIAFGLTVVILGWAGLWLTNIVGQAIAKGDIATDFWVYRDNGARFLETGQLYFPEQIAGPHANYFGHSVYYPPNALLLLAPISALPLPVATIVWWGIPLGVVGYVLYRLKPQPWAWPVMALLLAWPRSLGAFAFGNSDMWVVAAIAAGTVWGWPAVLVLLKPSLAPFALIGIRRRSWWIALAGLALVSLPFLPLWFDYLTVLRNAERIGWWYSLGSVPLLLIPLVAWLGQPHSHRGHVERGRIRQGALEPDCGQ